MLVSFNRMSVQSGGGGGAFVSASCNTERKVAATHLLKQECNSGHLIKGRDLSFNESPEGDKNALASY